jgi:hypothetical protein
LNLQNPEGSRFYGPLQLTVSASHAHHGGESDDAVLELRVAHERGYMPCGP